MEEISSQGAFDCLHPTIEQRGRIKEDGETTFKVSIQDCLACSGCAITKDEITIISEQSTSKIFEKIDEISDFVVLVSTPCVANLAAVRDWSVGKSYAAIKHLFEEKGAKGVYLDTEITEIWRKLLIKEFIEKDYPSPFLISRCAGSVVYYQRKTKIGANLAQIKPYPQLFACYIKNVLKSATYVIYVGPCFDRKLEASHFENEVDAVLTIGELNEHIEEVDSEEEVIFPIGTDADYMTKTLTTMQKMAENSPEDLANFVREFEPTMSDEEIETICNEIPTRLGTTEVKSGSYEGETANKRLTNITKNGRPCPRICLIDYCKGSCCAGGGLIRGDTPAKRRELIAKTKKAHQDNEGEMEVAPDLYQTIVEMGYSTTYESVEQEKEENTFDW